MRELIQDVGDLYERYLEWLRSERGQNTVEYLMMLAVIVGVILVIGKMFKPQISGIFNQIMRSISGAAATVSSGG